MNIEENIIHPLVFGDKLYHIVEEASFSVHFDC